MASLLKKKKAAVYAQAHTPPWFWLWSKGPSALSCILSSQGLQELGLLEICGSSTLHCRMRETESRRPCVTLVGSTSVYEKWGWRSPARWPSKSPHHLGSLNPTQSISWEQHLLHWADRGQLTDRGLTHSGIWLSKSKPQRGTPSVQGLLFLEIAIVSSL